MRMGGNCPATHPTAGGLALLCGAMVIGGACTIPPEVISELRISTVGLLLFPSRATLLVCGLYGILFGILGMTYPLRPRWYICGLGLNLGGLVLGILVWASMGRRLEVVGMLAQSIRLATPIALGALAGVLSERCGVINIAIEGMMLSAACLGFIAALYTRHPGVGLLAAVLTGGLLAALHAVMAIHGRVNQIISGTAINMLAIGGTGFLRRALLLNNPYAAPAVFPTWAIPWLADIPVLGPIFFRQQPMVYTMFCLVLAVHVLLFATRWGLRTRAVGEHPRAADTLGVSVYTIRYVNVVASGLIAGLGGAWFSLETVGAFEELMTSGKGFIALAAMIFGRWQPIGAFGGALLFGFTDAMQIKLQIVGVHMPHQFLGMAPYLATIVVLARRTGRTRAPAAAGTPYRRGVE